MLGGAASHFSDQLSLLDRRPRVPMSEDGKSIESLPPDYYSSRHFTDFTIESIRSNLDDKKPFFAYLAFQAPHTPLAIPEGWHNKYRGEYDAGYDSIRQKRLARQIELGLVTRESVELAKLTTWSTLSEEERLYQSRLMETYASMVENIDTQVVRLVAFLKDQGLEDNTYIFFLSDNGAEGGDPAQFVREVFGKTSFEWFEETFDNSLENIGYPKSWVGTGPDWAQVSMTPFRLHKAYLTEGGIRAPLLISGPGIEAGQIDRQPLHIADLAPTILSLAKFGKINKPVEFEGQSFTGRLLDRESLTDERTLAFEMFGQRSIRKGDWKAYSRSTDTQWSLFNLETDPAELIDQSGQHKSILNFLTAEWDRYQQNVGVVLPRDRKQPPL
jgi:arylsulfatase